MRLDTTKSTTDAEKVIRFTLEDLDEVVEHLAAVAESMERQERPSPEEQDAFRKAFSTLNYRRATVAMWVRKQATPEGVQTALRAARR